MSFRCARFPKVFPNCVKEAEKSVKVSIKNFPREIQNKKDSIDKILSDIYLYEDRRTRQSFSDLKILEKEVMEAYLRAARAVQIYNDMEISAMRKILWEKIEKIRSLKLRRRHFDAEFRSALECKGLKEPNDWPRPWWRYEEFRRTRRTWAQYIDQSSKSEL